ncbi:MAG: PfkB family carbohydrate kinase, partial [Planctomycetaceae bacterium]
YPFRAIASTAPGDAFTVALVCGWGGGRPPLEAARRAAAAGALAATRPGAQPSLPTRGAWEAFLAAAGRVTGFPPADGR